MFKISYLELAHSVIVSFLQENRKLGYNIIVRWNNTMPIQPLYNNLLKYNIE